MSSISPFRTPWTAALVALLVIWSIWLLGMPATRSSELEGPVKDALNPPQVPPSRPGSGYHEAPPTESSVILEEPPMAKVSESSAEAPKAKQTTAPEKLASQTNGSSPVASKAPSSSPSSSSSSNRPLILFAYKEAKSARTNLQFFLKHGLHGTADFIFILNGETDAEKLIPSDKTNVKIIKRENKCMDLGAYAEVLTNKDLYKKYKRFIMLNASIRGPFVPHWADRCWSDAYLGKVTAKNKLVGMTFNCTPKPHVQSMIWATDNVGLDLLLNPPKDPSLEDNEQPVGINTCFDGWDSAVVGEIGATPIILNANYTVDVMMSAYHKDRQYIEHCDPTGSGDVLWNGHYEGINVHPYETIFMKTNRDIDPATVAKLTEWHDAQNYSSYDYCT